MAVPQIRGDLRDIFDGDGPPIPIELRGHDPAPVTVPIRPRRRSHHDEMLVHRLQGQWHPQYPGDQVDRDFVGGVGDVHGVGNAAGHLMNEAYGGSGRYRVPSQVMVYVDDEPRAPGRRVDSTEWRLADRTSPAQPRTGPAAPSAAARKMAQGPDAAPQGWTLRQHSLEELYNRRPRGARSGQVVGARLTRTYEDESEAHAPASRRRELEEPPRPSDMAGLNGPGQGMNRVSQWRAFVEPGVPDGESTLGHA